MDIEREFEKNLEDMEREVDLDGYDKPIIIGEEIIMECLCGSEMVRAKKMECWECPVCGRIKDDDGVPMSRYNLDFSCGLRAADLTKNQFELVMWMQVEHAEGREIPYIKTRINRDCWGMEGMVYVQRSVLPLIEKNIIVVKDGKLELNTDPLTWKIEKMEWLKEMINEIENT